ncbi:MAG: hypothetical protein GKR94_22310 [Gammaproteobacteria bacterium]|nr:hypothetical protein [Gammaproteobacteria bacterium]
MCWLLVNADIDYWRPISFLSHGLDFALFGHCGGVHHLTSVLRVLLALLALGLCTRAASQLLALGLIYAAMVGLARDAGDAHSWVLLGIIARLQGAV